MMTKTTQILGLLESYPLPEGICLWRVPDIAPEGYTSFSTGSVLVPKYDEGGSPCATAYAYFHKGETMIPVEITMMMTEADVIAACESAVSFLEIVTA